MSIENIHKIAIGCKTNATVEPQKKYLFVGKDYPDVELKMFRKDSILLSEPVDLTDPSAPRVTGEFFRQFSPKYHHHRWPISLNQVVHASYQRPPDNRSRSGGRSPMQIAGHRTFEQCYARKPQIEQPGKLQQAANIYSMEARPIANTKSAASLNERLDRDPPTDQILSSNQQSQMPAPVPEGSFLDFLTKTAKETVLQSKEAELKEPPAEEKSGAPWEALSITFERSHRRWEPSEIAYWMLENDRLSFPAEYVPSLIDKVYFVNMVTLRNPKVALDPTVGSDEFLVSVNANLGPFDPRSAEEGLRWIYKAALRHMLLKYTDYQHMHTPITDDRIRVLQEKFYPGKPQFGELLKNSTFASKKKFYQLFEESPAFRLEYMSYVNTWAERDHYEHCIKKYKELHKFVVFTIKKKPHQLHRPILYQFRKRLCMTVKEVREIIQLMNRIAWR